jgi:hypothetical protein
MSLPLLDPHSFAISLSSPQVIKQRRWLAELLNQNQLPSLYDPEQPNLSRWTEQSWYNPNYPSCNDWGARMHLYRYQTRKIEYRVLQQQAHWRTKSFIATWPQPKSVEWHDLPTRLCHAFNLPHIVLVDTTLFRRELQALTPNTHVLSWKQCLREAVKSVNEAKECQDTKNGRGSNPLLTGRESIINPNQRRGRLTTTSRHHLPPHQPIHNNHPANQSNSNPCHSVVYDDLGPLRRYQGQTECLHLTIQRQKQAIPSPVSGIWSGCLKRQPHLYDNELKGRKYMLEQILLGLSVIQPGGFLCLRIHSMYTTFTRQCILVLIHCFKIVRIICRPMHPHRDSTGRIHRLVVASQFMPGKLMSLGVIGYFRVILNLLLNCCIGASFLSVIVGWLYYVHQQYTLGRCDLLDLWPEEIWPEDTPWPTDGLSRELVNNEGRFTDKYTQTLQSWAATATY